MPAAPIPRVVVFDLGGVLIRICRSWRECCAAAGLPVHEEREQANTTRQRLARQHHLGEIDMDAFVRGVAEAMGGLYTVDEVHRAQRAMLLAEYPGVVALTADIRRAGMATGILSNTNHDAWVRQQPRALGGTEEFLADAQIDHPHASHILGLLKPGEAIYRAFERATGFAGAEAVFFDDLEENVAAARAVGWQAELIDHAGDTAAQMRALLRGRGIGV